MSFAADGPSIKSSKAITANMWVRFSKSGEHQRLKVKLSCEEVPKYMVGAVALNLPGSGFSTKGTLIGIYSRRPQDLSEDSGEE